MTLEIKNWFLIGFSVTRLENDEMNWILLPTVKNVFKGSVRKKVILLFP